MPDLNGYLALGTITESGEFTEIADADGYARQAITFEHLGGSRIRSTSTVSFSKENGVQWPSFDAYAFYEAASGGEPIRYWNAPAPEANDLIGARPRSIGIGGIEIGSEHGQLPLTQAQYDALDRIYPDTLYAVLD